MALHQTVFDLEAQIRDLGGQELEDLVTVALRRLREMHVDLDLDGYVPFAVFDEQGTEAERLADRIGQFETGLSGTAEELRGIAKRLGSDHEEHANLGYVALRLERLS